MPSSCLPQSKHVKLAQACYPKSKTAATRPNQSELQYLAYYAVSRPKKLIKVGSYLKQRVTKDAYRRRYGEICITLDICATLIEKCSSNLNLFGADIVAILQIVLETHDAPCVQHSLTSFSLLCNHLDNSAIDANALYADSYARLLHSYGALTKESPPLDTFGVQALMCACAAASWQGTTRGSFLALMSTTALHNLLRVKSTALYQLRSQIDQHKEVCNISQPWHKTSTADDTSLTNGNLDTQNHERLNLYSFVIIKHIFLSNDSSNIRVATSLCLDFAADKIVPDEAWLSTLLQIATEWVPLNLRFHVLSACVDRLRTVEMTQSLPSTRHQRLLTIVYALLTAKISLVGLSTNDVLDSLLDVALVLLQHDTSRSGTSSNSISGDLEPGLKKEPMMTQYLARLSDTIIALSNHSYYSEQMSDTFRFLLERAASLETTCHSTKERFKEFHLDVAARLLEDSHQRYGSSQESQSIIKPSTILPGLVLLKNCLHIRAKFAGLLLTYLQLESLEAAPGLSKMAVGHAAQDLGRALQSALYCYLHESSSLQDIEIGFRILQNLHYILPKTEMIMFLPMVIRLQREDSIMEQSGGALIAWNSRLRETILLILTQCTDSRLSQRVASSHTNNTSWPDLMTIDNELRTFDELSGTHLQNTQILEPWAPETGIGSVSRAASVRQRNRLVSGATASRENFELGSGTILAGKLATNRIATLKQTLQLPSWNATTKRPTTLDQSLSLDDLFENIEMTSNHNAHIHVTQPQTSVKPAQDAIASELNYSCSATANEPDLVLGKVIA